MLSDWFVCLFLIPSYGHCRKVCWRMAMISPAFDRASANWWRTLYSSLAPPRSSDTVSSPSREIIIRRGKLPKHLSSSCRQSPKIYCRKNYPCSLCLMRRCTKRLLRVYSSFAETLIRVLLLQIENLHSLKSLLHILLKASLNLTRP